MVLLYKRRQKDLSSVYICVEILESEIRHPTDMMAEETSTGNMEDNQPLRVNQLFMMTTVAILPTDYAEIERPAPRRVLVEVAEEASIDDTKIEKCMYEIMDNNETTKRNCLKYLSSWSREGSWNWPRRPGMLVWKRSSLFWWKTFYHRLPK